MPIMTPLSDLLGMTRVSHLAPGGSCASDYRAGNSFRAHVAGRGRSSIRHAAATKISVTGKVNQTKVSPL